MVITRCICESGMLWQQQIQCGYFNKHYIPGHKLTLGYISNARQTYSLYLKWFKGHGIGLSFTIGQKPDAQIFIL